MEIRELYDELRQCYTSSESTFTDKLRRFRTLLERFARIVDTSLLGAFYPLSLRLSRYFERHNVKQETREKAQGLINELNHFAHEDKNVVELQLRHQYRMLLEIIWDVTGIAPDEVSQNLAGICDTKWYTLKLNEEKKQAVLDDSQVISVNAGPGTGKTYLLVWKIMSYLAEDTNRRIVALSFTNSAARQLGERVKDCLALARKNQWLNLKEKAPNCTTSTIHRYCFQLLREYYKARKMAFDYEIIDEGDVDDLAHAIALSIGAPQREDEINEQLLRYVESNIRPSQPVLDYLRDHHYIVVRQILALFLKECEDEKKSEDKKECEDEKESKDKKESEDKPFMKWLQNRIDCLLVDEDQDLTKEIYNVIAKLIETNPQMKMFFVGDPRQNIFSFNGGSYNNFKEFVQQHSVNVSIHRLTHTYRCPQAVIDKVNPLHFLDCDNPPLVLDDRTKQGSCEIISSRTREEEGATIARIVERCNDFDQTCVLATGAWYLENTARALNSLHIPFVIKGGHTTMLPEIKKVNRWLKAVFLKEHDVDASEEVRKKIEQMAKDVRDKHAPSIAEAIRNLAKYGGFNYEEQKLLEKYAIKAEEYQDKELSDFLYDCSNRRNDDFEPFYERDFQVICATKPTQERPAVTLSTIHSAKGLEWDNVIVAGVENDVLPGYRAKSPSEINEELKKYYVAVTRCKKHLYITWSQSHLNSYGREFPDRLSQFVVQG